MPATSIPSPVIEPQPFALRRDLRQELLSLPYRAFLHVVLCLLTRQGCSAVHATGCNHWKGRNQSGGWDAEAEITASPIGTLRCLVQVKQFDTLTVQQRQVDELRGSCLRAGAQQALLVTLSAFSPIAQQAAKSASHILPMRLIDGETLLDLLIENGLGVILGKNGQPHIDEGYFHLIRDQMCQDMTLKGNKSTGETLVVPGHTAASVTVIVRLPSKNGAKITFHRL